MQGDFAAFKGEWTDEVQQKKSCNRNKICSMLVILKYFSAKRLQLSKSFCQLLNQISFPKGLNSLTIEGILIHETIWIYLSLSFLPVTYFSKNPHSISETLNFVRMRLPKLKMGLISKMGFSVQVTKTGFPVVRSKTKQTTDNIVQQLLFLQCWIFSHEKQNYKIFIL